MEDEKIFIKILYLHDANSYGADELANSIEEKFNLKYGHKYDIQVLMPSYKLVNINQTIEYIQTMIIYENPNMIVGVGLGAWFTMMLNIAEIPAVLINPILDPVHDVKILTNNSINGIEQYINYPYNTACENNFKYLGLFSQDDELYNYKPQCLWHRLIGEKFDIHCGHNLSGNYTEIFEFIEYWMNHVYDNTLFNSLKSEIMDLKTRPRHTIDGQEITFDDAMDILPGTLSDDQVREYNEEIPVED